jgi:hypothetical protein
MTAVPAAELLAAQPPLLERPGALAEIRDRIGSHGRLLVIDDDPTGTQSVHGVPVLTAWSREDLAGALQDAGTVCCRAKAQRNHNPRVGGSSPSSGMRSGCKSAPSCA